MNLIQNGMNFLRRTLGRYEICTFSGGIHPKDSKKFTKDKEIIDIAAPKILVYPMQQHIGGPANPLVNVGDRVLMGQKIGEASGFVSANIHSSVSGAVIAIEPRLHPSGAKVNSIVVENDGLYENCIGDNHYTIDQVTKEDIVNRVREAGITGMGGAAFPTHVKLSPPEDKKIEYVIVNGAECEPYLTSDHRMMLEHGETVVDGLKLVLKLFDLKSGYIAIETNKPDAIARMREIVKGETEFDIRVVGVKTKYPQGSEKHLIKAVTGRSVPPGKLPMDVGAVVNNVDTFAAIERAVLHGIPLIKRVVTVSGDCIKNPSNLRVPVGTSFNYIIEACGGLVKPVAKLIMGGPMMGMALVDAEAPVIKGSSGLLAFSEDMIVKNSSQGCLRCGRCVSGCPMNLMPNMLKEAVLADDIERLAKLNINDCLQCGSCTYMCPAEQNPLQYIRTGKLKLRNSEVAR